MASGADGVRTLWLRDTRLDMSIRKVS